jgi:hypothetical protein
MDELHEPPAEGEPAGPAEHLAGALSHALSPDFPERGPTALHLAELLLDAAETALPLAGGSAEAGQLAAVELLATSADVFAWEGPPGWDEVLARGLLAREPLPPGASVLDGVGAEATRSAQHRALLARTQACALLLLEKGRAAAALRAAPGAAAAVVAAHAALLRLIGCAAAASALSLPEEPQAGDGGPPSLQPLLAEMDARAAAGGDFTSAQEEWLARLSAENEAAAQPGFRTFFAGISQVPRIAIALRAFHDEARAGRLARDSEAVLGAIGGWQPVRWASLRRGVPAAFFSQLCPAPPPHEAALVRLARECEGALEVAGRLWFARGVSLGAFTALAAIFTARCASVLALWEELGGGATMEIARPK